MTERPDGCYRWVIFDPDCKPEIAYWSAGSWHLRGDVDEDRVHKVGVGGTLDAPPAVWDDDLPPPASIPDDVAAALATAHGLGKLLTAANETLMDIKARHRTVYGTDDPDMTP